MIDQDSKPRVPSSGAAPLSSWPAQVPFRAYAVPVVLVGVSAFFALQWAAARKELQLVLGGNDLVAPVAEGRCDVIVRRSSGVRESAYCDEDGDGVREVRRVYQRDGIRVYESVDEDGDGRDPQQWSSFDRRGVLMATSHDGDGDGFPEQVAAFDRRGKQSGTDYDGDGDGRFERWEVTVPGGMEHWFDDDGDGNPERMERRDHADRVLQRMKRGVDGWSMEAR